ncbi:MAG: hypothetical protein Q9191_005628 [Dirinaria sp. TL-2023a]
MSTTGPSPVDRNTEQGSPISLQQQITALENRILEVKNSTSEEAERARAIDECLACIARVSNAIKDASPFLAAYDQRNYSNSIKILSERLQEIRSSFAPKRKFAFKKKQQVAPSQRKDEESRPNDSVGPPYSNPLKAIHCETETIQLSDSSKKINAQEQSQEKLQDVFLSKPGIYEGIFNITERSSEYLEERASAFPTQRPLSASITAIKDCIINIAPQPTTRSLPFAKIHILDGCQSLFICGSVDQNNLPTQPNLWDQVEDFMWLRPSEPSPNWRAMAPHEETIPDELWQQAATGTHGIEILGDLLNKATTTT